MKSRKRFKHISACLAAAVAVWLIPALLGGCDTQGCADNRNALPLMGFYGITTGDDGAPAEEALSLDSVEIGGVGAPGDSLLVVMGERVQTLYLPFAHDRDEVAFFFRYGYKAQGLDKPMLYDTITMRYASTPYFASEECGAMYKYHMREVIYTRHLIDSVAVTDSVVTNVERERFKVYFRVASQSAVPGAGSTLEVPDDPDRLGEIDVPAHPSSAPMGKPAARGKGGAL